MRYFPWKELGYAFALIASLFVVYVVAYYLAVDREVATGRNRSIVVPKYRFGGEFFSRYHELDRLIRPDYWDLCAWKNEAIKITGP